MNRPLTLQEGWDFAHDPATVFSFDYEAIQAPTNALIHQAARFLYIKHGRGVIDIGGVKYPVRPNMLVAITPWSITEVTEVAETMQLVRLVYNYQYINFLMKGFPALEEDTSGMLQFLSMEPVLYLDSVQAQGIDAIMEQLKAELGVESTQAATVKHPLAQLYVTNKVIELIILYRRYVMAARGEKDYEHSILGEESVLNYIYAHSAEKLTLTGVASAFFISESTLSKRISNMTGLTFPKLVNSIRIEKTADYLIYTDLTLDEIAVLVGFVDASHLSKNFTAQVGTTPIKYRNIYGHSKPKFKRTDKNVALAVIDYIYKNFATEKLSANSVASHFGISTTEMNRLVLCYTDKNFETLLNFVRVNRACELLTSTGHYVIDIAYEVGYNNIKTFNMNFYKYKGMTPTEFRDRVTMQSTNGKETGRVKKPCPEKLPQGK